MVKKFIITSQKNNISTIIHVPFKSLSMKQRQHLLHYSLSKARNSKNNSNSTQLLAQHN